MFPVSGCRPGLRGERCNQCSAEGFSATFTADDGTEPESTIAFHFALNGCSGVFGQCFRNTFTIVDFFSNVPIWVWSRVFYVKTDSYPSLRNMSHGANHSLRIKLRMGRNK